jgi:hypothetical protein
MLTGAWSIIHTDSHKPSVIGDAPAVMWERTDNNILMFGQGFARPNVEAFLPVSEGRLNCVNGHRKDGTKETRWPSPQPLRVQPTALCALVGKYPRHRRHFGTRAESTLLEYLRFQPGLQSRPSGSTINDRIAVADRALRNEFPDAPCQIARDCQRRRHYQHPETGRMIGRRQQVG